ncbi:phage head morphogenesis protein [Bosea vaviloviae]|uniref:Phage head morphogenesis domain-containing protein n=1 Tax=Bosea vaviloviae TaxID=1526658 RepID=A0A0N0MB68_9HYPH|nr:phage minor head protein [Bosea vaviloviae]KPH80529.1 hypothetical protein AE618_12165 [Bosea vaviloviae]
MAVEELFKTAPREVVDYFDRRPSKPSFRWDEVAPREHALQFTVARTAGFDVLDDIRKAARAGVVDRVPFEQFRDELVPILKAKGWWGRKEVADPRTGEIAKVQLGSLRRLDLIYDANIRSAQAAGDWERIQRVKDVLPFLEYLTSTSERKRPLHLSWVGTTLLSSDSWWSTHYPPNGWRCKCRVRSRAAPREGAATVRPPFNARPWTNGATGETRLVPAGIDPGWDHNPGRAREQMASTRLVERLDAMGSEARRQAVKQMRADPVFTYVTENGAGFDYQKRLAPEQAAAGRLRWPAAVINPQLAGQLGTTSRVATLSVADAAKIQAQHPEVSAGFWPRLQDILDEPDAVVPGSKLALWKRIDGIAWRVILKASETGEIFVNSVHRGRDRLLAALMKREEGK